MFVAVSVICRVPAGSVPGRHPKRKVHHMTAATVTERARLTALRAAWLFDGTTIVAVDSGVAAPAGAEVVALGAAVPGAASARPSPWISGDGRLWRRNRAIRVIQTS